MDPFLEFSEGSGGTAAATSASPSESACATIRALEELQPFEPLAKKGEPPRLIRQVDTLMARHALHQQCIGELSAVAGAAGEEAKGLPSLLQELGGIWGATQLQGQRGLSLKKRTESNKSDIRFGKPEAAPAHCQGQENEALAPKSSMRH